jgi:hypothetical protein
LWGDADCWPVGVGVGDEGVVDGHVQFGGEGVQGSVQAGPPGSGCSTPLILDVLARRVVDNRALSDISPWSYSSRIYAATVYLVLLGDFGHRPARRTNRIHRVPLEL